MMGFANMLSMENTRKPRFHRYAEIPPIHLTQRDILVLQHVNRHRFLSSAHIRSLLAGSGQQLLRRLQLLYHHGYLERPRAQIDYYGQGGSRPIVYGVGTIGGVLLKSDEAPASARNGWSAKNQAVRQLFLQHALLT